MPFCTMHFSSVFNVLQLVNVQHTQLIAIFHIAVRYCRYLTVWRFAFLRILTVRIFFSKTTDTMFCCSVHSLITKYSTKI